MEFTMWILRPQTVRDSVIIRRPLIFLRFLDVPAWRSNGLAHSA